MFSAISNRIIIPRIVSSEFNRGTDDKLFLPELVQSQIVEIEDMTEEEDNIYLELTSSLDDGESATIAIAKIRGFLPIIDERKGRAKAAGMMAPRIPGWSLDIFRHAEVLSFLGQKDAIEALFMALRESHMRIPENSVDEVIALIGRDRAKECTCLPGYGRRFGRVELRHSNQAI